MLERYHSICFIEEDWGNLDTRNANSVGVVVRRGQLLHSHAILVFALGTLAVADRLRDLMGSPGVQMVTAVDRSSLTQPRIEGRPG